VTVGWGPWASPHPRRSELERILMRIRHARHFAIALLIGACLLGGADQAGAGAALSARPSVPMQTADDVASWALAPAGSADGSKASDRPDLSYFSTQGAVINDAVTLYNLGTTQMTFQVYATDAFNDEIGQFQLLGGGEQPTGVGSWVTLAQNLITVPAGTQATIPVTLTVPANAAPGDYAGGIVASVSTTGAGEQGKAITVERRTGTRLYARIGGTFTPELAVLGVTTDFDQSVNPFDGAAVVRFDVENRGNTRLGGRPVITVSGPFGIGEQSVSIDEMPEILPGERVTLTARLTGLPTLLTLNTEVRIIPIGVAGEDELGEIVGRDTTFTPPIFAMLVMLATILTVLGLRARRRRRMPVTLAPTATVNAEARELEPA